MTSTTDPVSQAVRAARAVASEAGYSVDDPCIVADSNHTIIWLRPHSIVAKVGRPSADGALLREHEIANTLTRAGAPVAPPVPEVEPTRESETGLLVTLWQRFEHGDEGDADPVEVGQSLRIVHDALTLYRGKLPSVLDRLEATRTVLFDDAQMSALNPDDRAFLRAEFDGLVGDLNSRHYRSRRVHGEPHGRNRLTTPIGVRWIDFESASIGPVEWDLAMLPEESLTMFPPADETLLELLRSVHGARTAALCWARYDVPALRWHADFHLRQLRSRSH